MYEHLISCLWLCASSRNPLKTFTCWVHFALRMELKFILQGCFMGLHIVTWKFGFCKNLRAFKFWHNHLNTWHQASKNKSFDSQLLGSWDSMLQNECAWMMVWKQNQSKNCRFWSLTPEIVFELHSWALVQRISRNNIKCKLQRRCMKECWASESKKAHQKRW